jgi:hypothetical protein
VTTTLPYDVVSDAAYDADLDVADAIRTDYSGRGMFGRECFGIVYDSLGQLLDFAAALGRRAEADDLDVSWLSNARRDSMGMSSIAYWPGVTLDGEGDS